jgi:hypothetical protein
MAQTQLTVPLRDGYNFGIGADLLSGAPLNQPVRNDVINSVAGAEGATVDFVIQRCQTTHDLEQALGISAEASYGSACFGAGISDRFKFAMNARIQSSSLFMTITATVKLKVLSIDAPTLTPEAIQVLDRPDIFSQRFGNVFVRSMERGGIFVGVLRVDTSSSTESESLANDLQGSYGLFSAEAQVKFSQVQKKYSSSVYVQMHHEGGPVDLKITDPTDPLELLRNANAFLESFATRPEVVAVPYLVTLAPIVIANGPLPVNEADLEHAQDVMRFCATRRSALLDQLNLLELITTSPSRYDFSNGASAKEIAAAAAAIQSDLDLIANCASAAINSPRTAKMPRDFAAGNGTVFPAGAMPEMLPSVKIVDKNEADVYAVEGDAKVNKDALAVQLRGSLPDVESQRGFNIAYGLAGDQKAPGPGKDRYRESLPLAERSGFQTAVSYFVVRNSNSEMATTGAAIAKVVPQVAEGRAREPDVFFTLGFDIATALYGDRALNAQGITNPVPGPGQTSIHDSLNEAGRRGFEASKKLHLGPPPLPRRA